MSQDAVEYSYLNAGVSSSTADPSAGEYSYLNTVEAVVVHDLTLAGTAPAAGASFTTSVLNIHTLTVAGGAPLAAANFTATAEAIHNITVSGTAPPAGATFTTSSAGGIFSLTLAGTAPLAAADITVNVMAFGVLSIAVPTPTLALGGTEAVVAQMQLIVQDTEVEQAPAAIEVLVGETWPESLITFSIDGVVVMHETSDATGTIVTTVPLSEDLGAAGLHTLSVTTADQRPANGNSAQFTVLTEPDAYPTEPGPDAEPILVPSTGVQRWIFQDLSPAGLGSWTLPLNPTSMSNPHVERTLMSEGTTAAAGARHVFESGLAPVEWQFSGYCPDQAMYGQLLAYENLKRRFYIVDHRGRAWEATILQVELTPRRRQRRDDGTFNDWAHDYTVHALVYNQNWKVPS